MKNILSLLLITGYSLAFSQSPPPYIPANGLMAWWPYNGNANDESGNGHTGTVNSASLTTDRFNNVNSAYSFNGTSSNIVVQDNLNFRPSSFTISSWIYFNTLSGTRMVLAKNCGTGVYESIGSYLGNSQMQSIIGTPSAYGQFLIAPNNLQTGKWYHYVDQFDDVNNLHKIFINGVMAYTITETTSIGYDAKPWTIGMEYENTYAAYYFNGKIDDIGIWNRILNNNEIMQVYQGALATGLTEHQKSSDVKVFPNPCSDQLTIQADETSLNTPYSLFNCTGQEIFKGIIQTSSTSLNINNLEPGIYLLKINNNRVVRILKK